jgi:parallel beta-helix repeat protein
MAGFILALITLPSVAVSVTAESDALVVPDDYATIQAAIDAAEEGSTVYVKAGVYHENLNINKSISLIGESYHSVFVDGNSSELYRVPCRIHCSNVSVSGFTFSDGWTGVQLMSGVSNCTISANRLINNQYGITASMGSGNRFTGNVIVSQELGYGISLTRCSNNSIEGNYISSSAEGIVIMDELLSPNDVTASYGNKILGKHTSQHH